MRIPILLFCTAFCLFSCQSESKSKPAAQNFSQIDTSDVSVARFVSLDFETGGKLCTATINQDYKDFKDKKDFPVSLFITINTVEKDKDGKPTPKEETAFGVVEENILAKLSPETKYCYIGRTRMDGYRDMIFYIPAKDQKKVDAKLKELKASETRMKEYSFDTDPKWEAVDEFYQAIKAKK